MAVDVCFISSWEVCCLFSNLSIHYHFSVSFTAMKLSSLISDGWTFQFTGFRFAYFFIWF